MRARGAKKQCRHKEPWQEAGDSADLNPPTATDTTQGDGMQRPKLKLVPAIKAEPLKERLDRCRAWLYLHGVLSESENNKVRKRILKNKQGATECSYLTDVSDKG